MSRRVSGWASTPDLTMILSGALVRLATIPVVVRAPAVERGR
jgi:hypothetical protein